MVLFPDMLWLHFSCTWKDGQGLILTYLIVSSNYTIILTFLLPEEEKCHNPLLSNGFIPEILPPKHQCHFLGSSTISTVMASLLGWLRSGVNHASLPLSSLPVEYPSGLSVLNTKQHNFKLSWEYNPNMMPRLFLLTSFVLNDKRIKLSLTVPTVNWTVNQILLSAKKKKKNA